MISKKILMLLVLLLPFLMQGFAQIKVVFRFDDFRLNNYGFNEKLLAVFAKNNIPLNLAVIPYVCEGNPILADTSHMNHLKRCIKNKTIDIQLHGWNHASNSTNTEFQGLPIAQQYKKIAQGKHLLDSLLQIDINTFIPPFNTYDSVTLKVLDSLKFTAISANRVGVTSSHKIKYIPGTTQAFSDLPEICKENKDNDAIIVIIFHPYNFSGNKPSQDVETLTFNKLDSLLNCLNINKYKCYTFSEIINIETDLGAKRVMENESYLIDKIKPPFYKGHVYFSRKYLRAYHLGVRN